MPLLPADQLVLDEALDGQGVPATINASIYAAIDAAGFSVVPSGGSPATIVDAKVGNVYSIDGFPGHYLKRVEHTSGKYLYWLEVIADAGVVQRISLPEAGSGGGGGSSAWADITGKPTTLAGYGILDAAAASHTHAASEISSGTIGFARLPVGVSGSTVCVGNDARLEQCPLNQGMSNFIFPVHQAVAGSTTRALVTGVSEFTYMGQANRDFTAQAVSMMCRGSSSGAGTFELGLFTSPAAPNKAGQTLTKVWSASVASTTTSTTVRMAATQAITAGTHVWIGMRSSFATTQTSAQVCGMAGDLGHFLTASTGAFSGLSSVAAALPTYTNTAPQACIELV
jgi:hypothetical protein